MTDPLDNIEPHDLDRKADQKFLARYIRRNKARWAGLSDEVKAKFLKGLLIANDKAIDMIETDNPHLQKAGLQAVPSIAGVILTMEGQNQRDEIEEFRAEREDSGQGPTVTLKLYGLTKQEEDQV